MLVLTSLVLGFAMFGIFRGLDLVWLHLTPIRPCLNITIWEASRDARLLRAYPFLFCFARCYTYHACLCHLLAFYASLHACLHVYAWVLLACVSSMLQDNEVMDIRSKPIFVPRGHHLLFAFLLVCFVISLLVMSIMLICFMPISYALCIFSFYYLFASFLSLPLHVHIWSKDTWS